MLTGEVNVTDGRAFVGGHDITSHLEEARMNLGILEIFLDHKKVYESKIRSYFQDIVHKRTPFCHS